MLGAVYPTENDAVEVEQLRRKNKKSKLEASSPFDENTS
jgi:hypothetical protein